jgi:hypothetical protein
MNFGEFTFRNCPKSLGGARGVALRAAKKLLFESFRAPHTGQINVGALLVPLFGQFLRGCLKNQDGLQLRGSPSG